MSSGKTVIGLRINDTGTVMWIGFITFCQYNVSVIADDGYHQRGIKIFNPDHYTIIESGAIKVNMINTTVKKQNAVKTTEDDFCPLQFGGIDLAVMKAWAKKIRISADEVVESAVDECRVAELRELKINVYQGYTGKTGTIKVCLSQIYPL